MKTLTWKKLRAGYYYLVTNKATYIAQTEDSKDIYRNWRVTGWTLKGKIQLTDGHIGLHPTGDTTRGSDETSHTLKAALDTIERWDRKSIN